MEHETENARRAFFSLSTPLVRKLLLKHKNNIKTYISIIISSHCFRFCLRTLHIRSVVIKQRYNVNWKRSFKKKNVLLTSLHDDDTFGKHFLFPSLICRLHSMSNGDIFHDMFHYSLNSYVQKIVKSDCRPMTTTLFIYGYLNTV